MVKADYHIWTL